MLVLLDRQRWLNRICSQKAQITAKTSHNDKIKNIRPDDVISTWKKIEIMVDFSYCPADIELFSESLGEFIARND